MAGVHVDTWRETYRGLMKDAVLDDPGLLSWREKFWAACADGTVPPRDFMWRKDPRHHAGSC